MKKEHIALPGHSAKRPSSRQPPVGRQSAGRAFLRLLRRRRRLFAALLCVLALILVLEQLIPTPTPKTPVLVAARDLPLGATLRESDVRFTEVSGQFSSGALLSEKASSTGATLAIPLREGQPLSETMFVGESLLSAASPGQSAVPVRISDPTTAQLVQSGQRIDIFVVPSDSLGEEKATELLAANVTVLWTQGSQQGSDESSSPWGQGLETADRKGLIVVATDADAARRIATATGRISIVLLTSMAPAWQPQPRPADPKQTPGEDYLPWSPRHKSLTTKPSAINNDRLSYPQLPSTTG